MAGLFQRFDHASRIRDSPSGDVKGSTVIDRGSDDRKTQCQVHCRSESGKFHGDETLIVIKGDNGIMPLFRRSCTLDGEKGVRRMRTRDSGLRVAEAEPPDRRNQDRFFLVPEYPALTGVRVESEDRDPRILLAE